MHDRGYASVELNRRDAHRGDAEAQNFYGAVPAGHDFVWFEAEVENFAGMRVVQCCRALACNIFDVPDGEAFVARQHGGDAVALYIFQCGNKLSFDFIYAN